MLKYLDDLNENIEVNILEAYFNPIHSNKELVETNIQKFKEHLSFVHYFNTSFAEIKTNIYNDG